MTSNEPLTNLIKTEYYYRLQDRWCSMNWLWLNWKLKTNCWIAHLLSVSVGETDDKVTRHRGYWRNIADNRETKPLFSLSLSIAFQRTSAHCRLNVCWECWYFGTVFYGSSSWLVGVGTYRRYGVRKQGTLGYGLVVVFGGVGF